MTLYGFCPAGSRTIRPKRELMWPPSFSQPCEAPLEAPAEFASRELVNCSALGCVSSGIFDLPYGGSRSSRLPQRFRWSADCAPPHEARCLLGDDKNGERCGSAPRTVDRGY